MHYWYKYTSVAKLSIDCMWLMDTICLILYSAISSKCFDFLSSESSLCLSYWHFLVWTAIIQLFLQLNQWIYSFCFNCRIEAACAVHPTADVFINFASFRRLVIFLFCMLERKSIFEGLCFCYEYSAAASSMSALKQPTIRVVAIIAEGVPESDTKQLIAYARANNKVRNINSFGLDVLSS